MIPKLDNFILNREYTGRPIEDHRNKIFLHGAKYYEINIYTTYDPFKISYLNISIKKENNVLISKNSVEWTIKYAEEYSYGNWFFDSKNRLFFRCFGSEIEKTTIDMACNFFTIDYLTIKIINSNK